MNKHKTIVKLGLKLPSDEGLVYVTQIFFSRIVNKMMNIKQTLVH